MHEHAHVFDFYFATFRAPSMTIAVQATLFIFAGLLLGCVSLYHERFVNENGDVPLIRLDGLYIQESVAPRQHRIADGSVNCVKRTT